MEGVGGSVSVSNGHTLTAQQTFFCFRLVDQNTNASVAWTQRVIGF